MIKDNILSRMNDLGYYLHTKTHPDSLGYMDLLVAIRETPTRKHFDPELITLQLRDKNDATSRMSLKITPLIHLPQLVCPGQVTVHDRISKRVDFFTFGGTLEAITMPDETLYWLHSPAPILAITNDPTNPADQLASEIQLMLAVFQTRQGMVDSGFAQRLAQIDPFQFYLAALGSIFMRYQRAPALESSFHNFYVALLDEKEWLIKTGQWPTPSLTLGTLLSSRSVLQHA